jgi:nitroimidazol reductase NimA-like FMN-containing flavoprotein (pyridoxamine 5'-phosphate oxidase superfamily)
MTPGADLIAMARTVIDANRYMTVATADEDGRPWVSPVYFTPIRYRDLYWVSSPNARHSRNLDRRPDVSIVVFDSQAPIGSAEAVYMSARAAQVADEELADRCADAFPARFAGVRGFSPEQLQPPAPVRLYRASVTEHSVLIRGSDPVHGRGVDSRMAVDLS